MFNGWATYVFGQRTPYPGVNDIVDENNILNGEDGWILVNEEENAGNYSDLELLTMPSSRASSCSSSPLIDWNLTPPSCFERSPSQSHSSSNGGAAADESSKLGTDLEISIFENLLIEHPSVSVYYRYPRRAVVSQLSVKSSTYADESKENRDDDDDDDVEQELKSVTSSNSIVRERGTRGNKNAAAQCMWDTNKSIGVVSLSIIEQQRSATVENNRKFTANRLRRQNSLVRHQTLKKCQTKKLRQLQ